MKLLAPAKINLYLKILSKRSDSYHTLKTIFQTVSLYDELEIVRSGNNEIELKILNNSSPKLWGPKNIVWRACELFFKQFKIEEGVKIVLKKNIPVQAGLGGGSSDAAATLRGLTALFFNRGANLPKTKSSLHKIAQSLGADVPFFLEGGCATATGFGERLTLIPQPPRFWAVILKPEIGCSTAQVYRWLDEEKRGLTDEDHFNKMVALFLSKKQPPQWGPYITNSFEGVVFKKYPDLRALKLKLIESGARFAALSGSGSALFGIVANKAKGEEVREKISSLCRETWLVHTC